MHDVSAAPRHTVGELIEWGVDALRPTSDTARLEAEILLGACTGLARSRLIAFPETEVGDAVSRRYRSMVLRRRDGVPAAYLTGSKEFYSIPLMVTPDVLVPRPETELLVEEALHRLPVEAPCRVLDVGTGSGAIALAIKHSRPRAEVTAVDVDEQALAVARHNARALGLEVRCLQSDWFAVLGGERFDVIASNPPYVASDDPHLAGLLRFEPRLALEGGADGLSAFRVLFRDGRRHLAPGGCMVLEHGGRQRAAAESLATAEGWRVEARARDLAGHDRVIVVRPEP